MKPSSVWIATVLLALGVCGIGLALLLDASLRRGRRHNGDVPDKLGKRVA